MPPECAEIWDGHRGERGKKTKKEAAPAMPAGAGMDF